MGEGALLRLTLPPMTFDAAFGIDIPDDSTEVLDDEEIDGSESEVSDNGSDDDAEDLDEE